MATLIDDLLALSKLDRIPLQKEAINLTELARDVIADLHKREPSRKVSIEVTDPLPAKGDAHLITIVLMNLLGNAWKFTAQKTGCADHIYTSDP